MVVGCRGKPGDPCAVIHLPGDSAGAGLQTEKPGAVTVDPVGDMDSDEPSGLVVLLQTSSESQEGDC